MAEYGEAVGRTMTDMVNSATIFKRTGATDEEAKELAKLAEMYRNVADSEITSAEASGFLVSQMKAFGIQAENSIHILDGVNEVANHFATSTDDLQTALTKSASALATAGNSYEQTIALVTSGVEVMQGQAGTVGNGLRTIAINVANLATKQNELIVANGKFSISLKDTNGEIRSTYDILSDLAQNWDKLNKAEQNAIAVQLSGKTRYNVLTSVLRNFADAQSAYTTALNSQNSAIEENNRYIENSIQARKNAIKAQWEQLVLSTNFEKLEKTILDAGTALLKFANSDIGSLILKSVALGATLSALAKGFSILSMSIKGLAIAQTMSAIVSLIPSVKSLSDAITLLNFAIEANPLFFYATAVTAGILAVTKAVNYFTGAQNRAIKAVDDSTKAYKEQKEVQDNLEEQIKALDNQIDSINDKKVNVTNKEQLDLLEAQHANLISQKSELKNKLKLEQKITEEKKKQAEEDLKALLNQKNSYKTYSEGTTTTTEGIVLPQVNQIQSSGNFVDQFKEQSKNLYDFELRLKACNTTIEQYIDNGKTATQEYANAITRQKQLQESIDELQNSIGAISPSIIEWIETQRDSNGVLSEEGQLVQNLYDKVTQLDDSNGINLQVDEESEDDIDALNEKIDELEDNLKELTAPLSNAEGAYATLQTAIQEFNESGGYTAETIQKLAMLDESWLSLLQQENGQLSLNKEGLKQLEEATKAQAIASLQAQFSQDAMNIAMGNFSELSPTAQTAISDVGVELDTLTEQTNNNTKSILGWATAVSTANAIANGRASGGEEEAQKRVNAIRATEEAYEKLIEDMNNWSLQSSSSSSRGSGGSGSSKDPWVEAFEREKKDLKHKLEMNLITEKEYYDGLKDLNEIYFGEISGKHEKYLEKYRENEEEAYKCLAKVYEDTKKDMEKHIEDAYENAIKKLQKEEKKAIDEVKKSIDKLKKEKNNVLDGIQDQIDGLKKEKDATEDYWNNQINLIKQENTVLQQQNELLQRQQELQQAKARKVMVVKDGRFQLTENEADVAKAEQNLSNYEDQLSYEQQIQEMEDLRDAQAKTLEDRIKALEEYKDYMSDYYDSQIEAMEEYRDKLQEQYDMQVEALQAELDAFKEGTKQFEEIENAKLNAQVMATNEEAQNYEIRLRNLKNYINEYNRLISSLGIKGVQVDTAFMSEKASHQPISIATSASGTASVDKDGLMLVGESPNTELLIGSNLNNSVNSGQFVKLRRGDGVVNAESTSTLAGMLNMMQTPQQNSISKTTTQHFAFGNITLPNVKDGDSFVRALSQKFNNYSIQVSNNRA